MNARMPHNNYSDLEINKSRILSKCSTNFGRTQNHCYWKLEAQIFGKHSPTKVLSVEYELYCGWTNQSFSFWHCEFRNNSKISTEIQYSLHNYGKSKKTKNLSRNVLVSFWSDLEFLSRRNLYFELREHLPNILDLLISRLSEHFQYGRPRIHDKSSCLSCLVDSKTCRTKSQKPPKHFLSNGSFKILNIEILIFTRFFLEIQGLRGRRMVMEYP